MGRSAKLYGAIGLLSVGLMFLSGRAARAQDALAQIRARGELVIATDATYPPFEYKDKDKLVGFDVELGDEIGKELGVKVRWLPLEWTAVLGSLESRKADLIMSGMTITEKRKKEGYTFSRPYYASGQTIARRDDDNSINGLQDLKEKIISVQDETTGLYAVKKLGVPDNRIMKFDQLQDGLLNVRNRKSDAVVADVPALKRIIRLGYPDLKMVGGAFVQEWLGIAARHGELELAAALNQALDTILVDGRYARIYRKWMEEPLTTRIVGDLDRAHDQGTAIPDDIVGKVSQMLGKAAGTDTPAASSGSRSSLSIRWKLLGEYLPQLLKGAWITLKVTLLTLLFGATGGLLVALGRLSGFPPLKVITVCYVEVVRGTPLLMQIYTIFFVLPAVGISLDPMLASVVALSLNAAAYISEIFRAGIESIDVGQMEAARSLGLNYGGAMRWIILPQTVRRVLPPLTNEAVALLKDSSLISVVAVTELMRVGKEVAANTGAPTTLFFGVALLYLTMTLPLTYLVRVLETKWQPISRPRERRKAA